MKFGLAVLAATASIILATVVGCPAPIVSIEPTPQIQAPTETSTEEPVRPIPECLTDFAGPSEAAILESITPWTEEWFDFEDPSGDFLLDHPLFEENFAELIRRAEVEPGEAYNRATIPPALDIATVKVGPEGDFVAFEIGMARATAPEDARGEALRELLQPDRRRATIGIYIDVDRNGISDYVWTTTNERSTSLLLTPDLDEPIAVLGEEQTRVGDDSIVAFLPREIIGERFSWVAFSGYSPIDDAYFRSSLDEVFFVPVVDIYTPGDLPVMLGFSTSYSGTGVQCQVTGTYATGSISCPPQGNPPSGPVEGTPYQGVLMYKVICDGRGYGFWCIGNSYFGKAVFNPSLLGWVAKCPYTYGCNAEDRWDQDGDGLVDKIFHTISDRDPNCSINPGPNHHDQDNDGLLDVMLHTYLFSTNELVSCNKELSYAQPNVVVHERCLPAQPPYSDPASVPGYVP